LTDDRQHRHIEIDALRLSDEAIETLKDGTLNNRLVSFCAAITICSVLPMWANFRKQPIQTGRILHLEILRWTGITAKCRALQIYDFCICFWPTFRVH